MKVDEVAKEVEDGLKRLDEEIANLSSQTEGSIVESASALQVQLKKLMSEADAEREALVKTVTDGQQHSTHCKDRSHTPQSIDTPCHAYRRGHTLHTGVSREKTFQAQLR